ncbi:MAG TPA: alpha/beta hydrolase [Lacisediminihabitans sp.]|uniref:alpha/beta hydrolase n=1 Tax=Lacisediminihabitans sp. TaxID=2787631 RepID=UPI002EDADF67
MSPRWKKSVRRIIAAIAAVLLGAILATVTYHVSVQPGAAIVKAVFEAGPEVTPPKGFASVRASVEETAKIPVSARGVPAASIDVYAPRGASGQRLPVILWIHGGGFISSSADTVRDYAIMLAHAGYVVASLDYSLAPGARHPTPVVQGNAALAYLASDAGRFGGDPSRIVLGGDSAGAQIAGELAAVQTNPSLASGLNLEPAPMTRPLRAVVLFCGLYDLGTVADTGFPALRTYLWAYTGTRRWTDHPDIDQLSVTEQVTARYPATFLTVGDADPFRSQARELASVLRKKAVPVTTLFWNGTGAGLSHEYQFDFALPQANVAFERTLDFLAERTKE